MAVGIGPNVEKSHALGLISSSHSVIDRVVMMVARLRCQTLANAPTFLSLVVALTLASRNQLLIGKVSSPENNPRIKNGMV